LPADHPRKTSVDLHKQAIPREAILRQHQIAKEAHNALFRQHQVSCNHKGDGKDEDSSGAGFDNGLRAANDLGNVLSHVMHGLPRQVVRRFCRFAWVGVSDDQAPIFCWLNHDLAP
jgi:hypothetical protein